MKTAGIDLRNWPIIAAGYAAVRLLRARPVECMEAKARSEFIKLTSAAFTLAGFKPDDSLELLDYEKALYDLLYEFEEELK